jgi:hypothetical protein
VPARSRGGLPGLLQALQHDPQLLVLRPAPATARLHDFEPAKMRTVRMAIHTHSAQPNRSTTQGGPGRMLTVNPAKHAHVKAAEGQAELVLGNETGG